MPSVNDDMDELFRRAAGDYPLNTDAANWNKIKDELNLPIIEAPEKGTGNTFGGFSCFPLALFAADILYCMYNKKIMNYHLNS